jgi:hypothetical protein
MIHRFDPTAPASPTLPYPEAWIYRYRAATIQPSRRSTDRLGVHCQTDINAAHTIPRSRQRRLAGGSLPSTSCAYLRRLVVEEPSVVWEGGGTLDPRLLTLNLTHLLRSLPHKATSLRRITGHSLLRNHVVTRFNGRGRCSWPISNECRELPRPRPFLPARFPFPVYVTYELPNSSRRPSSSHAETTMGIGIRSRFPPSSRLLYRVALSGRQPIPRLLLPVLPANKALLGEWRNGCTMTAAEPDSARRRE